VIRNNEKKDVIDNRHYRPKPIFIPKQSIKQPQVGNVYDIREKIKSKFKRDYTPKKPVFIPPNIYGRTYILPKFTRKPISSVRSVPIKKTTTIPKTDPSNYSYFLFSKYLSNNIIDVRIEIIVNDTRTIYVNPLHIRYFREYLTFTKYTNTYMLRIASPSLYLYNDLLDKNNKIIIKVTIYDNNGNKIFENNYIPLSIVSSVVNITSDDTGNNTSGIFDITMVPELFLKMYRNYTFRKYVNMT
jgi:hypothetical protein